jgi:hypothetical protein
MTKRILIDQVAAHDLIKSRLMPILSQSGFSCCCTALAFENPKEIELYKKMFGEGGNDLAELFFDEQCHKILRSTYRDYRESRGISYYDAAVLVMAATQNCCILGSDPPLCKLAAELGVEVINYNILLGHLVDSKQMTLEDAIQMALTIYFGHNPVAMLDDTDEIFIKIPEWFDPDYKLDFSSIA